MFHRRTASSGLVYFTSPLLESIGVCHAFSTRIGGVSPAPFDSLNLGISREAPQRDSAANVETNYQRLMQAINCSDRQRCWVSQVHGAEVCLIRPLTPFANGPCADALVTDDPSRLVGVKYADCVPILLSSGNGQAVAAVHAGWRGVVAGVVGAAVRHLAGLSGSAASTLLAAIGPSIGHDAFEVGPEVLEAFDRILQNKFAIRRSNDASGKGHVDLVAAVFEQLIDSGLTPPRIDRANLYTLAQPAEFYSHRRDGSATGRMAALIGPTQ